VNPAVTLAPAAAHTGWRARLRLCLRATGGRTVLAERHHEGPLVVQRPFYPEGPVCHVYLVHPPGGVAGGDHLSLGVDAGPATQGVITTPAATKIYRSFGTRVSRVEQHLAVQDATLEWLPQETLVFRGAHTSLSTRVDLSGRSRFIGWEILCLGRPASREFFDSGSIRQDFELYHEERPLLLDRLRLRGGEAMMSAAWGLGGATALGTMLVFPADPSMLALARQETAPGLVATLVDGVLLLRLRADQGETVRGEFERIWRALRPRLTGLAALAPRIWAT
jgi:urease accessory protein